MIYILHVTDIKKIYTCFPFESSYPSLLATTLASLKQHKTLIFVSYHLLLKKKRARYILHICSQFGIQIQIGQTRIVLVLMAQTVKQKKAMKMCEQRYMQSVKQTMLSQRNASIVHMV
jgi:hypothetical protein